MQAELKARLRREARQTRAALPAAARARAAAAFPAYLPAALEFCARLTRLSAAELEDFAVYLPIQTEADSRPLIRALRAQNKKILLPAAPKHSKLGGGLMVFRRFSAGRKLERSAYGCYQPAAEEEEAAPQALFLPLLAFDARGVRLGYGGGCYDKAAAAWRARGLNPPLIGLGFAAQELPFIPAEPHDIRLRAALTERGLRVF